MLFSHSLRWLMHLLCMLGLFHLSRLSEPIDSIHCEKARLCNHGCPTSSIEGVVHYADDGNDQAD